MPDDRSNVTLVRAGLVPGTLLAVVTWVAVTRIGAWLSVRRGTRVSVQTALRSSVSTSSSRCSATFRDSGSP
jgi:hypothetical protein